MRRRRRLILMAFPVLALLTACAAVFFNAQRELHHAAEAARLQGRLAFELHRLDPAALRAQSPGFERVAPAPAFTSGIFFAGEFYLTGPGGLAIYAADGTLREQWRTGLDLPASPLGRIVVGRLRGAAGPQLLIATEGAGLLALSPGSAPDAEAGAGRSFTQLLPADPAARNLTVLLPTATGDLLLGTRDRGLLLYSESTLEPVAFNLPGVDATKLSITALAADGPSVLAGTRDAGLLYAHAGTVDRIDSAAGLPDNQVEAIAVGHGKAYIGTPLGVAEVDLGSPHTTRLLAAGLFAHSLLLDPAAPASLLVGTLDQGLQRLPLAARPRLRIAALATPDSASAQRIDQIFSPGSNAPAYLLAGGSLLRASGAGWTSVLSPDPGSTLTDNNISALAFTPDGRLWVGFFDRGLDLLNANLTVVRHLEDDALFCINRLTLDPVRGTLAAATANGLVLFDAAGHPRQVLTRRDGLISDHINDIAFTSTGATLATPAGLTFLSSSGAASLYAFQGLVNNHVYALSLASPAVPPSPPQLLAGTLGGLSLLESESVRRNFTVSNSGLKHNWITAILPYTDPPLNPSEHPSPSWFIGTYGAGIQRMSANGEFAPIDLPANAPRNLIINPNAMLATPTAVYAGTLGQGLLVYLPATHRWSLLTRGLPSLNVTAFAQRNGQLFIGTDNGLVHIAEQTLAQFVSGGQPR